MDEPLNDTGRMQAKNISGIVADIRPSFIITSNLRRAKETARLAANDLDDAEFIVEPDIRERGCGVAEGLTSQEILNRYGIRMDMSSSEVDRIPGAEPFEKFQNRIVSAMEDLYGRFDGKRVLLVSHGGVIRTFYSHSISKVPTGLVFRNCSLISLRRDNGFWEVVDKYNTGTI